MMMSECENENDIPLNDLQNTDLPELKDQKIYVKKTMHLSFGILMTVGGIIGSGIFSTVKDTFKIFSSKEIYIVLLILFISGLICLMGALGYVELATRMPGSGGDRIYYRKLISPKFSIFYDIFYIFIVRPLYLAFLARVTVSYIFKAFSLELNTWIEKIFSVIIMIFCLIINCVSKQVAIKASTFLTIVKVIAILIITGGGIYYLSLRIDEEWNSSFKFINFSWEGFFNCWIVCLFSYDGFTLAPMVAGDLKNPKRDLFWSIVIGISIVTFLYLLAVASYSSILGYDNVKVELTIAMSAASKIMGPAAPAMAFFICCSTIGAILYLLYALSYVSLSSGFQGEIPKLFSFVHIQTRTPIISLFSITFISCLYTMFNLKYILHCATFLLWAFYFITFFCLWKVKLQTRGQNIPDIFEVPYFIPFIAQLTCVFVIIMCFYEEPIGCSIFAGLAIVTLIFQYVPHDFLNKLPINRLKEKIENFLIKYCPLEPARIEDFV